MIHWVHILLRILSGLAGLLAIYAAAFLYEDEQGKLQNRLEQWWIAISDKQKTAASRYAIFMQEVARVANELFDKLFGPKLFSWHALKVSAVFSIGSYLLFMTFDTMRTEGLSRSTIKSLLVQPLFAAGLFWYGSHQLKMRKFFRFLIHLFVALLVFTIFFGFFINYGNAGLAAIAASFLCDFAFIAMTRQTLRWCSQMERVLPVMLVILLNCFIAVVFLVGPTALYYADTSSTLMNPRPEQLQRENWSVAAAAFAGMNTVDGLASSVFVLLALVAIAHRILWPVLARALYALQGIGIARRRTTMGAVGIILLTHAGLNLPEQIKKIVEVFFG